MVQCIFHAVNQLTFPELIESLPQIKLNIMGTKTVNTTLLIFLLAKTASVLFHREIYHASVAHNYP